jgi:hypothetical protein
MRIRDRLLLVAALVTVPSAALGQFGTLPYTLEGVVAKNQAAAQDVGWFGISVGFLGDDKTPERWIGVTSFLNWNGDPFLGREELRRLMPGDPTLLLSGPPNMVNKLKTAPPGSQLVVRGILNQESRNFMVSGVKVTAGAKGQ